MCMCVLRAGCVVANIRQTPRPSVAGGEEESAWIRTDPSTFLQGRLTLSGERKFGLEHSRCTVRVEHQNTENTYDNKIDANHSE